MRNCEGKAHNVLSRDGRGFKFQRNLPDSIVFPPPCHEYSESENSHGIRRTRRNDVASNRTLKFRLNNGTNKHALPLIRFDDSHVHFRVNRDFFMEYGGRKATESNTGKYHR